MERSHVLHPQHHIALAPIGAAAMIKINDGDDAIFTLANASQVNT
jgi:hypothetical protein